MFRVLRKVRQMRIAVIISLVVSSWLSTAAAQPQQRTSAMIDVALNSEGHLSSRCESANGSPVSDANVELVRGQEKFASARSHTLT